MDDKNPDTGLYRRILAVVDLTDDSRAVLARARAVAAGCGAAVHALHVVEYLPLEPAGESLLPTVEIEQELINRATVTLGSLATTYGLEASACHVAAGAVKTEIIEAARELGADLLVIGGHERHGISALFNLTEDTILHAAPCDVLAVRLTTP
jgi:universal stress protein A